MFSVDPHGAVDVVTPTAPINEENIVELHETFQRSLSDGQPMVVLDMSDVPLVDSVGLESLLDIQQSLQLQGGTMKLACLSQLCQEILRVTGVAEHLQTYQNVKTAVGSFVK